MLALLLAFLVAVRKQSRLKYFTNRKEDQSETAIMQRDLTCLFDPICIHKSQSPSSVKQVQLDQNGIDHGEYLWTGFVSC